MWYQFLLENAHFAVNLFAALVFFAVFWLYFDAWRERRTIRDGAKLAGFFLLSVSFIVSAAAVESSILSASLLGSSVNDILLAATRIPALLLLIASLLIDPLEPHPDKGIKRVVSDAAVIPGAAMTLLAVPHVLYPILSVIVGFLYLRRATVGLENHLKPVAYSFFLLSISELLGSAVLFRQSSNIGVYQLVSSFGPIWIAEHACILIVAIVLGKWVFGYLLKQFEAQLFMIFTTGVLAIFLITTVAFTGLLVKNIQDESLRQLETDVKVLEYTLNSKKAELISDAQVLAQNPQVIAAVSAGNRKALADIAADTLLTKNESNLIITNDTGQVLARGEDRDRAGDSLSDDPLVKRAILGETNSSVVTRDGVVAPELSMRAATPIRDGASISGVIMTGSTVDNAYVDGLKTATGLDALIYGDNLISASTIVTADGKSRMVGIKEDSALIKEKVLNKGENYAGTVTLLSQPYFAAYLPLTDVDKNPVGMLFVGRPQVAVLQTAGRSIELTFLVTIVLLVFSIVPAYLVSRYISDQIS